jgi:hypothetical protein
MDNDLTPVEGNPFHSSDLTPVEGNPFDTKAPSFVGALKSGVQQFVPSAAKNISGMASAFAHPIDTGKNLLNLGAGEINLATGQADPSAQPGQPANTDIAHTFNSYLSDRYGSWDGFKKAIATDPSGVLMDLSSLAVGPEAIASRLPGFAGTAARAARAVNPLHAGAIVPKAATKVGNLIAEEAGVSTGVGADPIKIAAQSGVKSMTGTPTEKAQAGQFRAALNDKLPPSAAVDQSLDAMDKIIQKRADVFRSGMSSMPRTWVTDFSPAAKAFADSSKYSNEGGIVVNQAAADARAAIGAKINEFQRVNQGLYTPQNLHALKRAINDVGYGYAEGSPARTASNSVAETVKGMIEKAAPGYSAEMDAYADATQQIRELRRAFSLGEKGTIESASRKLNSALRKDVNASFGYRKSLLDILNSESPGISETLAGQTLATPVPRGMSRLGTAATLLHLPWSLKTHGLAAIPKTVLNLATQSPRLTGNLAYRTGQASTLVSPFYRAAANPLTIGGAWLGSSPFQSPFTQQ